MLRRRTGSARAQSGDRGRRAPGRPVRSPAIDSRGTSIKERTQMAESVQEFFDGLASRADAEKTAGMNNSYLFDIEGAGQWLVAVQDGAVSVTEGTGEADTTITTSEESFMAIVRGEQNPTTAYMTGKLKIKGDMGAAMKLQKLF